MRGGRELTWEHLLGFIGTNSTDMARSGVRDEGDFIKKKNVMFNFLLRFNY